jgi:tRNA-splicing ligase RtcB
MENKLKIFGQDIIDVKAIIQMYEALLCGFAEKAALMPDAHLGYSLPIGGVVATKHTVVPAWVGYDIGCGVCAVPTTFDAYRVKLWMDNISEEVYKMVPVGFSHRSQPLVSGDYSEGIPCTSWFKEMFKAKGGMNQLGTLGGGNHFIEIGVGQDERVWIVVHSGSRNVGHSTAAYYMAMAANSDKPKEGNFGFSVMSDNGKAYLQDLNFCLQFALLNRKHIAWQTTAAIRAYVAGHACPDELINRNHNHAEYDTDMGLWIHRKGATHAKKGMQGVIPGNMRDGSFIVEGRGNPDSLFSSSHGAGRRLGRAQAKRELTLEEFATTMDGIKAKVSMDTLDEAPMAYKGIDEVMEYQTQLVKVTNHIQPIINIKG